MAPKMLSVIAVLLLGAVSMTNSLPLALSRQESVQNNHFRRPFPQSVYPQETAQKSMLRVDVKPALASEMVYGQAYPQQSVQDMKPVPAPPMMSVQEAAAAHGHGQENDIMAHTADDCSRLYGVCRESGDDNWFFCTQALVYCRLHPV